MAQRPLIAISPDIVIRPDVREITGAQQDYIRRIEEAGGEAVILTTKLSAAERILRISDGLLLIGGNDLHPRTYGMRLTPSPIRLSPERRTKFEIPLVKAYLKTRRPLLAICLGFQTLNVACGGTVVQDILSDLPQKHDHRKMRHPVRIHPDTLLRTILGQDKIRVHSRHHQALGHLGRNICESARSTDGLTEAIELQNHPFAIGVQWHPELRPVDVPSRRLFRRFVSACRQRSR